MQHYKKKNVFGELLAVEWEPVDEFDKDLAGAMVNGLHGYDPRNNIGKHVVSEVLGI